MTDPSSADLGPIAFGERVLEMLDRGRFTATYKYAVLLGLMDLCLEQTNAHGEPPKMVTTRELAEKVVALYWPHSVPFALETDTRVLLQNESHQRSQAEILRAICRFRERPEVAGSASMFGARRRSPGEFERMIRRVEWKLIEMPLPRLQTVGASEDEFVYRIGWDRSIERDRAEVRAYQEKQPSDFDNTIRLVGRAGEHLCRLNNLLRPLIQRQWALMVARINSFEETRLHQFLFGVPRIPLTPIRSALADLQEHRCFYCAERLQRAERRHPVVDHFIPWARYPDNSLDNLVVAHERCNQQKREFLAAGAHVERWTARLVDLSEELDAIAGEKNWERRPDRTLGVARALYLRLPAESQLWCRGRDFEPPDHALLLESLGREKAG